jgi:hypothetical protein
MEYVLLFFAGLLGLVSGVCFIMAVRTKPMPPPRTKVKRFP